MATNIPCPRCGQGFSKDNYSTSRRDNRTKICPGCGTSEAMYDFLIAIGREVPEEMVKCEQLFYLYRTASLKDSPDNPDLGWECENSSTGHCVYDLEEDPAQDNCLVCGQPKERK